MSTTQEQGFDYPHGKRWLEKVVKWEQDCEAFTLSKLPEMGDLRLKCYERLANVLFILDCLASCRAGCRGGDHTMEHLAGRAASFGRCSLRMALRGFYDESLALTRSIGELANLLFVLNKDLVARGQWLASSKSQRINQFGPKQIRERLKALSLPIYFDDARYGELCEVATHATPHTKPQAFNPLGIPCVGGHFQEGGFIVALNELCMASALVTIPLPKLLEADDQLRQEIQETCYLLIGSLEGVHILSIKDANRELFERLKAELHESCETTAEQSNNHPSTDPSD